MQNLPTTPSPKMVRGERLVDKGRLVRDDFSLHLVQKFLISCPVKDLSLKPQGAEEQRGRVFGLSV